MKDFGINPYLVTLLCVLTASFHVGLIEEAHHYFDIMRKYYHVVRPTMDIRERIQDYSMISERESDVTPSTKGNIIRVLLYQGSSQQHQRTYPDLVKPTWKIIRGKTSQFLGA